MIGEHSSLHFQHKGSVGSLLSQYKPDNIICSQENTLLSRGHLQHWVELLRTNKGKQQFRIGGFFSFRYNFTHTSSLQLHTKGTGRLQKTQHYQYHHTCTISEPFSRDIWHIYRFQASWLRGFTCEVALHTKRVTRGWMHEILPHEVIQGLLRCSGCRCFSFLLRLSCSFKLPLCFLFKDLLHLPLQHPILFWTQVLPQATGWI